MVLVDSKMTQAETILELLRERGSTGVSNFELMKISYQYPARLHTLRHKHGHVIENKLIRDKEWRITLIEDANAPKKIDYNNQPKAISWLNEDN
jgi:hypothetical protein